MGETSADVVWKVTVGGEPSYLAVAVGTDLLAMYEAIDGDLCEAHINRLSERSVGPVKELEVGGVGQRRCREKAKALVEELLTEQSEYSFHCYLVNARGASYERDFSLSAGTRERACRMLLKRLMRGEDRLLMMDHASDGGASLLALGDESYAIAPTERGVAEIQAGSRVVVLKRDWCGLHVDILDAFSKDVLKRLFIGEGTKPMLMSGEG